MKRLYQLLTGNSPASIVLLVLIAIMVWVPSFLPGVMAIQPAEVDPMPLYGFFKNIFDGLPELALIFSFLLFLITAFLLDYLNTRFILVQERTYLPVFFFILFTSFSPGIYQLNPLLPSALMVVLILHAIFSAYKKPANILRFFDAGLLLGLAALFYAPSLWFILFIWASLAILRPFYWREWLHPVLGVFCIFFVAWSYFYVIEADADIFFSLLISNLKPSLLKNFPDTIILAGSMYILLLIVFSSFFMLKVFQFRKIYARNFFIVLFWLFVFSMLFFLYPTGGNYGMVYIFSFPVAYITTNYFVHARKTRGNRLLFWLGVLWMVFVVAGIRGI